MIMIKPSDWKQSDSKSRPVDTTYRIDFTRGPIQYVVVEQKTNMRADVPWYFRTDKHASDQRYRTAEEAKAAAAKYLQTL